MKMPKTLGQWAYVIGFFGAVLLGLFKGLDVFSGGTGFTTLLVIAGLVIGFMNVTKGESLKMMVVALVLGAGTGVLATLPAIGGVLEAILIALATVFIPTAIVVAVMTAMRGGK